MPIQSINGSPQDSYGFFPAVARSASSLAFTVYYKILSKANEVLGDKEASRNFECLNKLYLRRTKAVISYFLFRKYLIFPTANIEKHKKIMQPMDPNRLSKTFNSLNARKPVSMEFDMSKITTDKITSGVCFAFSLKFLARYFALKKEGKSSEEAIRILGNKYIDGASAQVGILQSLSHALKFSENWYKSTDFKHDPYRTMANAYDLRIENTYEPGILLSQDHLNDLKDGAYLVRQAPKKIGNPGHIVVYIKEGSTGFIFDPGIGTMQAPIADHAKILNESTRFNGKSSMDFMKCSPNGI